MVKPQQSTRQFGPRALARSLALSSPNLPPARPLALDSILCMERRQGNAEAGGKSVWLRLQVLSLWGTGVECQECSGRGQLGLHQVLRGTSIEAALRKKKNERASRGGTQPQEGKPEAGGMLAWSRREVSLARPAASSSASLWGISPAKKSVRASLAR